MSKKQVKIYKFDGCEWFTFFDPNTGFYVRQEREAGKEPFWGPMPELLDVSITNRCSKGCPYCYQNSAPNGNHMPLEDYRMIMEQARGHVQQIALGGGEPTEYPDFVELLRLTREDYGIVPNYTTNGSPETLTDNIVEATKEYCGAVAVSWHEGPQKLAALQRFIDAGIPTNIHFIVDNESIDEAIDLIKNQPFPDGVNAIIFLLHKPVGRASHGELVLKFDDRIREFLELVQQEHKVQMGFDACFASALAAHTEITQDCYDTCDGGRFSCYIDVDLNMSPCSFDKRRHYGSLRQNTIKEIWMGQTFADYREYYKSACSSCPKRRACMGGCALHPEIVMCERGERTTTPEGVEE